MKQQQKEKEAIENSHAGVAEPIDEDSIILEETTTKKVNFYKIEKPTTTSGLSTWILLSGQTSPPPPKTTKRIDSNLTAVTEVPNRIMKPVFKKRVTTTTKKPQTTISDNVTVTSTSAPATTVANITKLNKIKASVLNNAKKSSTTTTTTESAPTTILVKIETTNVPKKNTTFNETADMNTIDSNSLPLEPKDGDTELSTVTTTAKPKKTRRPTTKRKKNSNRKRRPSNKNSNSTDVSKPSNKEETLSFGPMYNYLKKQVMPAVEAGLVGLVVTAGLGLAGYFLYPFGAARRTYDIDRKDKGSYYYTDDYYSGGIAEEEAIGKVIAGMQVDNYDNTYRKYPKASYPNIQYKPTNMERINNPSRNYNSEKDTIEQNKETSFSVDDKQFVVGNMPKEIYPEVTPVTVPEHGPRRRRQVDEMENDIFSDDLSNKTEIAATETTQETTSTTTTTTTTKKPQHEVAPHKSFLHLLNDLFRLKINLGLQLLHNATESVARYLVRVQKRVNDHYAENNRTLSSCL